MAGTLQVGKKRGVTSRHAKELPCRKAKEMCGAAAGCSKEWAAQSPTCRAPCRSPTITHSWSALKHRVCAVLQQCTIRLLHSSLPQGCTVAAVQITDAMLHPQTASALLHNLKVPWATFRKTFPLYMSVSLVPYVVSFPPPPPPPPPPPSCLLDVRLAGACVVSHGAVKP